MRETPIFKWRKRKGNWKEEIKAAAERVEEFLREECKKGREAAEEGCR